MIKRRVLAGVAFLATTLLAWWMAAVGPVTIFRIVYYNRTGIEDYKNFPSRPLHASESPTQFVEPDDASLSSQDVARLERSLRVNDTVAFLVVRGNAILFERYYQGWTSATPSQSFSMAKSFLSMLVGAAVDDGFLASVDDVVTRYVPELTERGFDQVTIEDLLQMRSGSNYIEDENPVGVHARFTYTADVESEILRLKVKNRAEGWRYKSGDTALLTLVLKRALAPKTLTEYMREKLWSPLGMEGNALWTIDRAGGLEKTWCCLAATARDYAKLGRLYLQHGRFRDEQILPGQWVLRSVETGFSDTPLIDSHHRRMGVWNYSYHWWLVSQKDRDFMAAGHGGQYLYVNPATDSIVVRLGRSAGDLTQPEWIDLFRSLSHRLATAID